MFDLSRRILGIGTLLSLLSLKALASEVYWVDPSTDTSWGMGSRVQPFASIEEGLSSGKLRPGDELRLISGYYGNIVISGAKFQGTVTIAAESSGGVHAESVRIENSSNITVSGFNVWPIASWSLGGSYGTVLVETDASSDNIEVRDFVIKSREDVSDYPSWTKGEWFALARSGVYLRGANNTLEGSRISGVAFGVATTGRNARVENNVISGFSADAIRGLGDNSIFRKNRILDCISIDDNHADAFQSWSVGADGKTGTGIVRGLVIEGNFIHEWSSSIISPYRCSLQGIGMFDGPYEGTIVQNNIIIVSAYHGIMISAAFNSKIVNNTVLNSRQYGTKEPWIGVGDHKNGVIKSEHNIISNNIAHSFRGVSRVAFDGTLQINLSLTEPSIALVDPGAGDFSPIPGGRADGKAIVSVAPAEDFYGRHRSASPDIGAVENLE